MMRHVLTALGLSFLIYGIAPKVWIDPQHMNTSEDVLIPPKDVVFRSWNKAEKKLENIFIGPESLTHNPDTGEIYTGTLDGMIWRINKDVTEAKPIMRIGEEHQDCGLERVSQICGRILGLKFVAPDKLIVTDVYNGIIAVDLTKLTKEVLVKPSDQNILTKSLKIFNSVDVSTTGIVYFTVSTTRWFLHDFIYGILDHESTGRVYSYNLKTRDLNMIADNISFANGIALTHDETSIIVNSFLGKRIYQFNLLNLKEKPKILIENLPGYPDNIKRIDSDHYYLAVLMPRHEFLFIFLDKHPLLNRMVAWFVPKWVILHFFSFYSQIYKLNGQGNIVEIINGTSLQNSMITEAYKVGNKILLGNLAERHLGVIDVT